MGDFESADEVPAPLLPHAAARDTVATATGTAIQRPRMRSRRGLSDGLMCMAGSFLRRRPWGAGRAVAALVFAIRSVVTLLHQARHHIPRMCVSGAGADVTFQTVDGAVLLLSYDNALIRESEACLRALATGGRTTRETST
jgi:hypothetical protein